MPDRVSVERDQWMATGDATRLTSDVYLPSGEGPFPTLLYRVRGSKDSSFITGTLMLNPIVAAAKGYAVVVNQVRGRGASEGEWHPFVHEAKDGLDVLQWVVDQPWCDGRVGVYGSAYAGATALLLAASGHEAIGACVAFVTGANYHDGWIYTSGAFELGWNNFWAYLTAGESLKRIELTSAMREERAAALADAMKRPRLMMEHLPLREQPALEDLSPHYWTWLDHPLYDEYWSDIDVVARADQMRAPLLQITGWWDNFQGSHLQLYRAVRARSPAGADQRLVIGPWDHFTYVGVVPTRAGDRDFGPAALAGNPVVGPMTLAWMDRWLRGQDHGEETRPGVRYFVPGPDEWRDADSWPPAHQVERWYLRSGGELSAEAPGDEPPDEYRYDPAQPVPTVGGRTLMPTIAEAGIKDQGPLAHRPDVLVYDSAALTEPIEIAGPVAVELWVATTAEDTDFTAKLVDVAPDGYAAIVADGIVRGRHRLSTREESWLVPGEVNQLVIDLWDTAWRFGRDHRIRVEVASSNFPRFDRNLNIRAPLGTASLDDAVVATQTVYHDDDRPSTLLLSVTST